MTQNETARAQTQANDYIVWAENNTNGDVGGRNSFNMVIKCSIFVPTFKTANFWYVGNAVTSVMQLQWLSWTLMLYVQGIVSATVWASEFA